VIDYDGRRFSPLTSGPRPVASYHQQGDLIWGEFAGGEVRRGSLAGSTDADGVIRFGYCMVLDTGAVLLGDCRSVPEILPDGRIRLTEYWQRYGDGAGSGISYLEELALEVGDGAAGRERQPADRHHPVGPDPEVLRQR
jgi:hypothetical protein